MPIEIRELVIRARVDPDGERSGGPVAPLSSRPEARKREVVRACVREVLRILADRKER